jgi:predicted dehydrogenase
MAAEGRKLSRRSFVRGAGAGAALFTIVPRHVLGGAGKTPPSDKLNIAGIGVGGQGGSDIRAVSGENIVALCDVDERRAGGTFRKFPKAKRYGDFRKMLDEMHKGIDAVVVGTPDHTHAVACLAALERSKHVYCEKPLAHSIHEIRRLRQAAREAKVVTQVGNQGHSSGRIRSLCEWVWDGAIGKVTEVHAACDAFGGKYSAVKELHRLKEKHQVPKELDWDLWLGPAQERPYHPMYVPTWWRAWLPFGTGRIGDWICHVVDPAFWALDLGSPATVRAEAKGYDPNKHALVYPPATKVTYEFAAKGKRGPVTLCWYDGEWKMPHPECLEQNRKVPGTGAILIGEAGGIMHGSHGAGGARIIPDKKMRDYKQPARKIPRVRGHHADWLDAIREGRQAGSSFDYGGQLTELALLGLIAIRFLGRKLQWDAEKMQFPNCAEANRYLNPPYRTGWTL